MRPLLCYCISALCHFTTGRQGILQRKKLQFKEWLACSHQSCRQERQHPYSGKLVWLCWRVVRVWYLGAIHTNGDGTEVVDSEVMAEVLIERNTAMYVYVGREVQQEEPQSIGLL